MNWKESQYEIEQLSLLINSDDGWKTLVQKLFESSSLEVAFFCLSAITDFVNKRCVGNWFYPLPCFGLFNSITCLGIQRLPQMIRYNSNRPYLHTSISKLLLVLKVC